MTQAVYLKKGATTIYIESAKVTEVIANKLIKTPRPVTRSSQDTVPPGTVTVDIKDVEHIFTVDGYLSNSVESGNDGYSSAKAVKNALITEILWKKGDIELHYRDLVDSNYGSTYRDGTSASTEFVRTALDKIQFLDVSLRADAPSAKVGRYHLIVNLTRGKIR